MAGFCYLAFQSYFQVVFDQNVVIAQPPQSSMSSRFLNKMLFRVLYVDLYIHTSSLCCMVLLGTSPTSFFGEVLFFFFQVWQLDLPTSLWSGILILTPPCSNLHFASIPFPLVLIVSAPSNSSHTATWETVRARLGGGWCQQWWSRRCCSAGWGSCFFWGWCGGPIHLAGWRLGEYSGPAIQIRIHSTESWFNLQPSWTINLPSTHATH